MKCLDLILPGALSNAGNLPIAYPDRIHSAGTLLHWEPAHPSNPFTGLPTAPAVNSGATIDTNMPNLASGVAQTLVGSTNVLPIWTRNDGNTAAPNVDMFHERSAKGGLHVITSQTTENPTKQSTLRLPNGILSYLFANQTHELMLSVWYRVTRVALANTGPYIALMRNSGANDAWFNISVTGPLGSAALTYNVVAPARNTLGITKEQIANTRDGSSTIANIGELLGVLFGFGIVNGSYGDHARNKAFSAILYRVVLEDLTVAGRTAAQFAAVDNALQTSAFSSTGRYYNDTFTDPSILP